MTFPNSVDDQLDVDGLNLRSTQDYILEAVNDAEIHLRGIVKINDGDPFTRDELVYIDAKDPKYGMEADGVTNDQAGFTALAADVTAASAADRGVHLHFPKGTYLFNRQTFFGNYLKVTSDGATLLSTQGVGSTNSTLNFQAANISIDGLTLDHTTRPDNLTFQKQDFCHGVVVQGNQFGINGTRGLFCRITNVNVLSAWFSGIQVNYYDSVVITGCRVQFVPATGIFVNQNHNIHIANNTVYNTGDDCIFSGASTVATDPTRHVNNKVVIMGNNVSYSAAKGIGHSGVEGSVIANNNVEYTQGRGIQCYTNSADGYGTSSRVVIANNVIRHSGRYQGWHGSYDSTHASIFAGAGAWSMHIVGNIVEDSHGEGISISPGNDPLKNGRFIISNNTIDGVSVASGIKIGASGHVDRFGCYDSIVSNNVVKEVDQNGISILCSTRMLVVGNLIKNWGKSETGTRRGIQIDDSDKVLVANNFTHYDVVSGSTKQSITIVGTCASVRLTNNVGFTNDFETGTQAPGNKVWYTGTAAPGSGTYAVGDTIWNSAPAASGFMGWVCTTAGTPGTWKTFGPISA